SSRPFKRKTSRINWVNARPAPVRDLRAIDSILSYLTACCQCRRDPLAIDGGCLAAEDVVCEGSYAGGALISACRRYMSVRLVVLPGRTSSLSACASSTAAFAGAAARCRPRPTVEPRCARARVTAACACAPAPRSHRPGPVRSGSLAVVGDHRRQRIDLI